MGIVRSQRSEILKFTNRSFGLRSWSAALTVLPRTLEKGNEVKRSDRIIPVRDGQEIYTDVVPTCIS